MEKNKGLDEWFDAEDDFYQRMTEDQQEYTRIKELKDKYEQEAWEEYIVYLRGRDDEDS